MRNLLKSCFVVSMFMVACSKEKAGNNDLSPEGSFSLNSFSTRSFSNPYESYGVLHNNFLDYIIGQPDFNDLSFYDKYDLAISYLNHHLQGFDSTLVDPADTLAAAVLDQKQSFEDQANTFYLNQTFNLTEKKALIIFDSILVTHDSLVEINQLIADLNTFENAVNAHKKIRTNAKKYFFFLSAIARHSSQFWADLVNDQSYAGVDPTTFKTYHWGIPAKYDVFNSPENPHQPLKLPLSFWMDVHAISTWSADCPSSNDPAGCENTVIFNAFLFSSLFAGTPWFF